MPGGNKPDAVVSGTDVTVSWTASKFTGNINVAGYVVKRYATSSSTAITPNADCAGTIAALTCTEHSVPAGSWQYTVTPKQGNNWVGAESTKSTAVTVDTTAPQLTTLEMFDNTTNTAAELGVIDQVVATFNETLAACPGNPTTG